MPPSPALRSLPPRESHKRGHSFENEVIHRNDDDYDDLALFREMESRERQDFLLQSCEDFEDMLSSKPKPFPETRIGLSAPTRGENSELLNSDGDKNDYEWLLTPPETPLFPSLDDDPPLPAVAINRGRPRSQPISISRSHTMEKSTRSSRGSASPNRLTPSPRSGSSIFQSKGRPSSASRSSPSPSRRPSPPPHKPSTPTRRSSPTPMSYRPSSVTATPGSSGGRGPSPARKSRGNSPSPKIIAWQPNIPGFLMDTPPNLRTSIGDRPASYVRGSSPASQTSRDSYATHRRKSTSPTPRSASSSHSHDRDHISCQSRGSLASSMDDDSDSLQSGPLGGSECSFTKRVGTYPGKRNLDMTKKPSRIVSPAPKRSFDSAIRQSDHRKSSQSMFRPLLSSAPTSSFYIGKNSSNYPIFTRNSSTKLSNTPSSDQSVTHAPDTRAVHSQADFAEYEGKLCSDAHEDVFACDEVEVLVKDEELGKHDQHIGSDNMNETLNDTEVIKTSEVIHTESSTISDVYMRVCSECRCQYRAEDSAEIDIELCPDCRDASTVAVSAPKSSTELSGKHELSATQLPLRDSLDEGNLKQEDSPPVMASEKIEKINQDMDREGQLRDEHLDVGVDSSITTGISVLLKKSDSSKGLVFQGRAFVASPKPFESLLNMRDSTNSLRSSIGYGTASASSSVDYGSIRQTASHMQRQFSGNVSDMDISRSDEGCLEIPVDEIVLSDTQKNDISCSKRADDITGDNDACPSLSESSSSTINIPFEEDSVLSEEIKEVQDTDFDSESTKLAGDCPLEEHTKNDSNIDVVDVLAVCSNSIETEVEALDVCEDTPDLQMHDESLESKDNGDEADVNMAASNSDEFSVCIEESKELLDSHGGSRARSLTLEEATDAILFCRSIIHDLAYKAASVSIDRDTEEAFEDVRPTVTVLGQSNSETKDTRSRNFVPKRNSKATKPRKVRDEEPKRPSNIGNDENVGEDLIRSVGVPEKMNSSKPPKLESKCNCAIM